ncbi:hypothetical protein [Thalassotalea piscium]|uniref:Uncharacterized protein n=1 Tax=Thalassotalea piscium TaxID=1230533 RepID=A0A7X0NGQ2_9GAMM|nr:hypothetical protein [Thalassotalea piscium]MBB6543038.1 hypothetical protein [Thalassotalea piscium]
MSFIISIFLLLESEDVEAKEFNIDVLTLMSDAKPISNKYVVDLTINSPYKVVKVNPFYYSNATGEFKELPQISDIQFNSIRFNFETIPEKQEFLFFHVVYGPNFVFERNSEAICYTRIETTSIVDDVNCDTYTTTNYLIAAAEKPSETLFSADIAQRIFELEALPDVQSWQNFQAIIAFTLNHISEKPDYLNVSLPGNYLSSMVTFTRDMLDVMKDKRRINVLDYDQALLSIDKSLLNIAYQILLGFEGFAAQHIITLPHVIEYPAFLEDFFSGISSYTLVEPEAMSLPNIQLTSDPRTVSYVMWPWFDHIKYSFESASILDKATKDNSIDVPAGVDHLYIRPFAKKGRYLRSIVQVNQVKKNEQISEFGD